MLDFLRITKRPTKHGVDVFPRFVVKRSEDLMIRGSDFYAIWIEERGVWSTDENDAVNLIDNELRAYAKEHEDEVGPNPNIFFMWDSESGVIDKWHKYCQKQMRDNYHMLDETLIFSDMEVDKKSYASKRLNYPLAEGDISAYDKLMSVLYSEEERRKIEWAIGSIITGDSKHIQKFLVLYGSAGTGKSTVLNIIQQLFEGYYSVFDAKALGSASSSFALEAFKTNPLVAIQHDGDLSKIEDNTRLNSLVSHELMTVNEKFKSTYTNRFKCFLFMGTNRPVKITDAKSGLIRRLIDVHPTGNKVSRKEYNTLTKQISFELGAIAYHCKEVYLSNPDIYDNYIPTQMMGASNDFYNFVEDSYYVFKKDDTTTLKAAWEMYKTYCEDTRVQYPMTQRLFREELKNYFWEYKEKIVNGEEITRHVYFRFRTDKFDPELNDNVEEEVDESYGLSFNSVKSIFDEVYRDQPAQYANDEGTPIKKWENVTTKLSDIDTSKLHYVKLPENHIVIDFDIPGEDGEKDFEKNLIEASKFPPTYAELSKSGKGIHLHYIYTGDVSKLSRLYDNKIEVKIFNGNSSLRRKFTKSNGLPISKISSGLPLKGEKKMVNLEAIQNEKGIRALIKKNLNKEIHTATKPSMDFIYKILEDAYNSGVKYDVSDMRNAVLVFAANSSHQSDYCLKLINKMHFKSEEPSDPINNDDQKLIFYDVEVFPNLFVICYKVEGEGKPVVRLINPKPKDIEDLMKFRLVGFNCRRYDNHILYARLLGYTNEQLYKLSQKIINGDRDAFFGEAYNVSYTDIYDFASAGNKKSLKKLEIEMGIHHQELGLPWDQPVPEKMWNRVAEYCDNDVIATEAAFNYLSADWTARQILADLAGMTVNDTTNQLTQRIIFGKNKHPQDQFNYRNLALPVHSDFYPEYKILFGEDYKFRVFNSEGLPEYRDYIPGEKLPQGWSILPFFPGYKFEFGKSTYLDEEIGEGGRVYSEPGMYVNVWDGDIASQHPHSILAEMLFGPKFTKAFEDIVYGRVNIKHEAWDVVDNMLDGKLRPYIEKVKRGEMTSKQLANALKTAINSVYGLTSASFPNAFRDPRNKDNIVAKRGALFMTLLKKEVQKKGFTVCHIKTDSIKIPDATQDIIDFVIKFGKEYGYTFETEAVFEKFCLVNDAVYIAKEKDGGWTATGKQFAVPYVFKTLFSKEPIEFNDMCETFAVSKGDIYLDMNEGLPDVTSYEKSLDKIVSNAKKLGTSIDISGNSGDSELDSLVHKIEDGHNYVFIGRVGQFCPVKSGTGGGVMYRMNDNKYYATPGSTGFRWKESEIVKVLGNEDDIDLNYYRKLVDDAVETISKYGDFEWFVSNDIIPDSLPEEFRKGE